MLLKSRTVPDLIFSTFRRPVEEKYVAFKSKLNDKCTNIHSNLSKEFRKMHLKEISLQTVPIRFIASSKGGHFDELCRRNGGP